METFQTIGAIVGVALFCLVVVETMSSSFRRIRRERDAANEKSRQEEQRLNEEWNAILTRKQGRTGGGSSE